MKTVSFSIFKGGTGKTTTTVNTAAALVLSPVKHDYDFILIDTPPGKAMLAFNGLAAADLIIIPASSERMAVDGVADLITHVQKIMWSKFALTHQELRILFTMYRATTTHSPAIVDNARKIWRDNVLNVKIPHSTAFSRSYDERLPIVWLEPNHPGAIAYNLFADWLIEQNNETA